MTTTHPVRTYSFRAMASEVSVTLVNAATDAETAFLGTERLFADHEASLSRFRADSELSRANLQPDEPAPASEILRGALTAAYNAYLLSDGLFDPRVLSALQTHGYGRTFSEIEREGASTGAAKSPENHGGGEPIRGPWTPEINEETVTLGGHPIDLGGIGKGYAVDNAMAAIKGRAEGALVNAGGDMVVYGPGPAGDRWRVAVENPADTSGQPVAILEVTDTAIATSSLSVRTWIQRGRPVHHLIDPRTGDPAWTGLIAVTALAPTVTQAEILTKTLFLGGAAALADAVEAHGIAALWITDAGKVAHSSALAPHVLWGITALPQAFEREPR